MHMILSGRETEARPCVRSEWAGDWGSKEKESPLFLLPLSIEHLPIAQELLKLTVKRNASSSPPRQILKTENSPSGEEAYLLLLCITLHLYLYISY